MSGGLRHRLTSLRPCRANSGYENKPALKGLRLLRFALFGHALSVDGRTAKFWIPAQLSRNFGLRPHELREVLEILIKNEALILEKWNEIFGH